VKHRVTPVDLVVEAEQLLGNQLHEERIGGVIGGLEAAINATGFIVETVVGVVESPCAAPVAAN